jgi:hypothetical protein
LSNSVHENNNVCKKFCANCLKPIEGANQCACSINEKIFFISDSFVKKYFLRRKEATLEKYGWSILYSINEAFIEIAKVVYQEGHFHGEDSDEELEFQLESFWAYFSLSMVHAINFIKDLERMNEFKNELKNNTISIMNEWKENRDYPKYFNSLFCEDVWTEKFKKSVAYYFDDIFYDYELHVYLILKEKIFGGEKLAYLEKYLLKYSVRLLRVMKIDYIEDNELVDRIFDRLNAIWLDYFDEILHKYRPL